MHVLAFDVSRDTADGVLLSRTFTIKDRYQLPNTTAALLPLLKKVQQKHKKLLVGVESTALFHMPVVDACTTLKIPCKILNPLLTKEFLKSSIRKRKTDREDAVVIAKLLLQGEGSITTSNQTRDEQKTLVRSSNKLRNVYNGLKLHARSVEKRIGTIPTPLQHSIAVLESARKELQVQTIEGAKGKEQTVLTSIPGIGQWLATVLLSEMGDINRFPSGNALIAYAGLDPRVRVSGALLNQTGRLTKRGSPHLRWALFCAANIARMHDPDLKAFYEKKRGEGKSHGAATCATARKLTQRIYAVLRRGKPYVSSLKC